MRKPYVLLLLLVVVLLSMPMAAYAGTDATATVTIDPLCDIWFHPDGDLVFDDIDLADYDNGYTSHVDEDYYFEVRWLANYDWWLMLQGGEQYFTHDGDPSSKECSDIEFINGGETQYTPLPLPSEDAFELANGVPGTWYDNNTTYSMNLMFIVALAWGLDTEGEWYYDTITFTLSDTG